MEENHHNEVFVYPNIIANTLDNSVESSPAQGNVSGGESLGISRSPYTGNHDDAIGHPQEITTALSVTQQYPDEALEKDQPQSGCVPSASKDSALRRILHPIERCPSDVLQLIFEATCDLSSNSLDYAMSLSAVCRTWRRVALNTPWLWRKIHFTCLVKEYDPSPIFNLLVPRIKMAPAFINIYYLGRGTADLLKRCDLTRIPVFEHLGIFLSDPECFLQLHTLPPFLPAAGTEKLQISSELSRKVVDAIWDIGKLLAQSPPISKLWLITQCTLHVTPSTRLNGITSLYLEEMRGVEMLTVMSSFTQLLHLDLFQVHFTRIVSIKEIYSPSLESLNIRSCSGGDSWLGQANFPALAVFVHTGPGFSDTCKGFIQKHNSITSLELSQKREQLVCIPKIAPQIQSLAIDPWLSHLYKSGASGTEVLPFPALKTLTVVTGGTALTLEDFEGVVCARCLPDGHSRSRIAPLLQPLHSLIVQRYVGSDQPVASSLWRESELLQSARQEVSAEIELIDWEEVSLSWV